MFNSLWPNGLEHTRLLCPPLSPGVCLKSCPLSQWWYWTISFSATPFSFYHQSFPASVQFSSVQFSHSVMSDSLQPDELQHARLPCLSPNSGAYSNSFPSSWWCHPTISSSVIPFSSRRQSIPAAGSFPMSQFFTSDGQSIGFSTSTSVLPMNI